jgi:hypothetical protein
VDYWYVRGARGSLAALFAGQRAYAPVKAWVVMAAKKGASGTVRLVREVVYPALTAKPLAYARENAGQALQTARTRLMPAIREYQGDIAVGALVIAVSLTLFLIMRLL